MVSDDGRYVTFDSDANNLVEGDFYDSERFQEYQSDVFVYDSVTKHTERIVFPRDGGVPNEHSLSPAISGNGKAVVYVSHAVNLVEDPLAQQGIYVTSDGNDAPVWPGDRSLTISDVVEHSLKLTWSPLESQQVLGYRIYQNGKRIGFVDGALSSFTVTGLEPTVQYTFKVEAVNQSYHLSTNGPTISTLDNQPPVWPENTEIRVEAIGPSSTTLSWPSAIDNVGVAKYRLYYLDEQSAYQFLAETPESFITLTNLTPEKDYQFKIYAGDFSGNWTADGPTITVKTLPGDQEYVESALFVVLQSGGKADLRWVKDELASIHTYEIWRTEANHEKQLVATVDSALTNYQDNGLLAETAYTYQIIGKNQAGTETYRTKIISVTTLPLQITSIRWNLDQTKGYAKQEGTLSISINGDSGQASEVLLTFKNLDNKDVEQKIVLTESATEPGLYEGRYRLPAGVTELSSLLAILSDSKGHVVTRTPDNWLQPIKVTGTLTVNVTYNGEVGNFLNGARLNAWSQSTRSSISVNLDNQNSYSLKDLIPADDYVVRLLSSNGSLLKEIDKVSVLSGRAQAASLAIDIPATLVLKVKNPSGDALSDVRVRLSDVNGGYIRDLYTDDNGEIKAEGFMTSQQLKAEILLYHQPYFPKSEIFTLDTSNHFQELTLTPFAKGKIQGKVKNQIGAPLKNIRIIGNQTIDERSFGFSTQTDQDGNYSLDVYEGELSVSFSGGGVLGDYNQQVTILANEVSTLDKSLESLGKGILDLKVYTKEIGKGWEGPLDINQLLGTDFQVSFSTTYRWGDIKLIKPIPVEGFPGDTVKVCVYNPYFEYVCKEVTLDDKWNATVEIYLEEKGGRVEGAIVKDSAGDPIGNWVGNLYWFNPHLDEWQRSFNVYPRSMRLSANLNPAGKYRLEFMHTDDKQVNRFAETEFEILDGEIKDLNKIVLNEQGIFSGQKGNSLAAIPSEAIPGSVVTLRGTYQHKEEQPLQDVKLLLEIPTGTIFKEGSIVVDGKVPKNVTYNEEQNRYEVTLSEVEPNQQGIVRYQILLDKEIEKAEIGATLRVGFKKLDGRAVEETIGMAFVRTPQITISGLDKVDTISKYLVYGKALTGSEVNIYVGNVLLGSTKTLETGIWSTYVDLPDLGSPRSYKLRAEVKINEEIHRSDHLNVLYDKNQPKIVSIVMMQEPGRRVAIDPSKGVARFPWVANGRVPVQFEVYFNDPNIVKNVYVHLGEESALATLEDGIFKVSMPFYSGDVYVTYDTVYHPDVIDPESIQTKEQLEEAIEEFNENLPYEWKDVTAENIDISQEENGTLNGSLNLKNLPYSDDVDINVKVKEMATYTPTEEDLAFSKAYGVDVYNLKYDLVEVNGDYLFKMSAILPKYVQQPTQTLSNGKIGVAASGILGFVETSVEIYTKKGDVDSFIDGFGSLGYNITRIEMLIDQLEQCPNPTISR
jgi:chitodextrinase